MTIDYVPAFLEVLVARAALIVDLEVRCDRRPPPPDRIPEPLSGRGGLRHVSVRGAPALGLRVLRLRPEQSLATANQSEDLKVPPLRQADIGSGRRRHASFQTADKTATAFLKCRAPSAADRGVARRERSDAVPEDECGADDGIGHNTNPAFRPSLRLRQLRSIAGEMPARLRSEATAGRGPSDTFALLPELSKAGHQFAGAANDEWAVQRARYMTFETMAPLGDHPSSGCRGRMIEPASPVGHQERPRAPTPSPGAGSALILTSKK